jgi:hypothetical protein
MSVIGYGHLNQIPIKGSTKEWFKKDLATIKKSLRSTFRNAVWIYLISLLFSVVTNIKYIDAKIILYYSVVFLPIFLLGYLMLHVLKTKGYDIRTPAP